jgi:hypothetical protein
MLSGIPWPLMGMFAVLRRMCSVARVRRAIRPATETEIMRARIICINSARCTYTRNI